MPRTGMQGRASFSTKSAIDQASLEESRAVCNNKGDLLTRNVPQLADVLAERRSSRRKSNISTEGVKGAPLSEGKIAASAGAIPSTY